MDRIEVPGQDILGLRAENPGPFTLTGTNSWAVGRQPAWLIDPGPALEAHLDALELEIRRRGGLGGIVLTHDHPDHSEAVPAIRERFASVPLAAARGNVDIRLAGGERIGPLEVLALPGHAPDHVVCLTGGAALTGDAVLGEGSVFIAPDPGALAGYLDGLRTLRRHALEVICPGHGPLVEDPAERIDAYIRHRLDRERRLVEALEMGRRTVDELLDAAWDDAPAELRPAAAITLAAHLDKLEDEGRLPEGVQRPRHWLGGHP